MKNQIIILLIACVYPFSGSSQTGTADSLGLPGDNLSLYGVLEIFKASENIEDFEKKLNMEDNQVNNLDLNENGEVDYIMVNDKFENDAHAFFLSVEFAEGDVRDVAFVAVEKRGTDDAIVQVIGDEDYYGSDYIVEPSNELKQGGKGSSFSTGLYVNVWFWPCVRYIYGPRYIVWTSPWSWYAHPVWWHPWRPWGWQRWHPACVHYRNYHVRSRTVQVTHAHHVYANHRQVRAKARPSHLNEGRPDKPNGKGVGRGKSERRSENRINSRQNKPVPEKVERGQRNKTSSKARGSGSRSPGNPNQGRRK